MITCTELIRRSEELEKDVIGEIVMKSPSKVYWHVPELCLYVTETYFKSSSFLFMDEKWRLIHSTNESDGDILCLILERVHSPSNLTIKFRMGIEEEDGSILRLQEHEFKYDGDKASIYLPQARKNPHYWKQLAQRGEMTFSCSFLSTSSENETSQNRPSKGADKLNETFERLFLSGDHHDIIIKVQHQEIRAHKLILVAQSPVFASMLRHDTIAKNTGNIRIEDCDPEAFREFLSFFYSGKLKNVSDGNVAELYVIADKYQVEEIKSDCVDFMMRNMLDENFCDFISLALRHSERDLLNFATDYFAKNVKSIIVTVKWQSFHKKYPVESNELYIKAITRLSPD